MAIIDGGGKTYTNVIVPKAGNFYKNYVFTGAGGFIGEGSLSDMAFENIKGKNVTGPLIGINQWGGKGAAISRNLKIFNIEVDGFSPYQYLFPLIACYGVDMQYIKMINGPQGTRHNALIFMNASNGKIRNFYADNYYGDVVRSWADNGAVDISDGIAINARQYAPVEVNGNYSSNGTTNVNNCTFGNIGAGSYADGSGGMTIYDLNGSKANFTNSWVFNTVNGISKELSMISNKSGTIYKAKQSDFFPSGKITLPDGREWNGGSTPVPVPDEKPIVNAGNDIIVQLPQTSVTLDATASDKEGAITYLWAKVSGSGVITNPAAQDALIINLTEGSSIFRLTVTDIAGNSVSDTVNVTLIKADTPPPTPTGITSIKTVYMKDGKEVTVSVFQ